MMKVSNYFFKIIIQIPTKQNNLTPNLQRKRKTFVYIYRKKWCTLSKLQELAKSKIKKCFE